MPPRRATRTGSNSLSVGVIATLVLLLVGSGTAATLWATGFFQVAPAAGPSREGQIAFPALSRPVKAYEAVTRDDLLHPETRQLNVIWLPEKSASPAMHRDLSKIIGRVIRRDKQTASVLTDRDFLPEGTRPGVTAGVPAGKRSVSLSVDRVPGLELLRQGDQFDLLAALPVLKEPESTIEQAALLGGVKPPDTRSGQLARQTGIKPLVLAGTMVALTQGHSQSTGGTQGLTVLPAGARNKATVSIIATIAVDPEEVSSLTEAIGLEVDLFCVARSGLPDANPEPLKAFSIEGRVPVVTTSRPVGAFSALSQDDLADPVSGRLNIYYFPPDRVLPGWVTSFEELQGRVLSHGASSGAVLTERDLLPSGTRPGITAAAPPGTSAVPIEIKAIEGLDRLQLGDHFVVFAHLPNEQRPSFPLTDWATLQGGVRSTDDALLEDDLRRGVRLVVRGATLLEDPEVAKKKDSLVVAVAVPTESVTALAQAIRFKQSLFAAAASGREEEAPALKAGPVPHQNPPHEAPLGASASETMAFVTHLQGEAASEGGATDDEMISVPVTARRVAAHQKLTVEDFIDPSTGRPRVLLFPKSRVRKDWVTDLESLIDRVVRREIEAGRTVTQSNLLPPGSQSGPTAGIPAGMRAITMTGREVRGLDGISDWQPGDRFELVMARNFDIESLGGTVQRGLSGGDAAQQALAGGGLFDQADVQVLSASAVLVEVSEPVRVTEERVTYQSEESSQTVMTPDGPVRTELLKREPRVQEREFQTRTYLFAVAKAEVAPISEALSTKAGIYAIPASGADAREGDVESVNTPSSQEQSVRAPGPTSRVKPQPRVVEHIRGNQRTRDVWVTPPARQRFANP